MATINDNFMRIQNNYLFVEVARRVEEFTQKNPNISLYRLGIGDTTEALPTHVIESIQQEVKNLAQKETYTGYGHEQGNYTLRNALCTWYARRGVYLDQSEIFISDGAKSDSANMQSIFGQENIVAIQNPSYPVYVDSNILAGRGGRFKNGRYEYFVYMPCTEEHGNVS